jgi:hypothetical protein
VLQRYLSLKAARIKTIAQYRAYAESLSDNPLYLAYRDRLWDALRKAGMPEE